MPKFKFLTWKIRYATKDDDPELEWDLSDVESVVSSEESEENDESEDETIAVDPEQPEPNWNPESLMTVEGDSAYTLFNESVRLYTGRRIKTLKCMKLYVALPLATFPDSPSPYLEKITPVSYYTAMDFGWSRSQTPGFTVFQDRTFVVRNSKAGYSNAIHGDVGFKRGIHQWVIKWDPAERGMHPVIGVGTKQSQIKSTKYEPLVSDRHAYGWHLTKHCLLHNIKYHRQHPFIAYPGIEFRDSEGNFTAPREITVLLDMERGTLSFKTNGVFLGIAFAGLKGKRLFPMISTTWGQAKIQMIYIGGIYPQPDTLSRTASRYLSPDTLQDLTDNLSFPSEFKNR